MTTAHLEHAGKEYGEKVKSRALKPLTLDLSEGELTLLLGPSGSGKTTLLNLLGGLDRPTEGSVNVDGEEISRLSPRALTLFRRDKVGFVFQFFNLVPSLTALENVQLAAQLVGGDEAEAAQRLKEVGLGELADRFPSELSGGQQQRVAIARALAKKPKLLLADEPTGALDHQSGAKVMELLKSLAHGQGCAVVVVTHDEDLVKHADRVIRLRDGALAGDQRPLKPTEAAR